MSIGYNIINDARKNLIMISVNPKHQLYYTSNKQQRHLQDKT